MTNPRLAALALALGAACAKVQKPPEPGPRKPEAPDTRKEQGVPPRAGSPRVPASPEALLAPGVVTELQRALTSRGLLEAHQDGELDDATTRALRRFQDGQGLAATGFPDRETLERLGLDPDRSLGRPGSAPGKK
ncbi:MAG: peptidoglycan-binding domain-containing protein [Anaeromyxobacteraceae bacterium]